MEPNEIPARARAASGHRPRRPFDPDWDRIPGRSAEADIREYDHGHGEYLDQGEGLVADAMKQGVRYERCSPHYTLFLKATERTRAHYIRACRAWQSGATDHLPVPIPDGGPVFDLADALHGEIHLR